MKIFPGRKKCFARKYPTAIFRFLTGTTKNSRDDNSPPAPPSPEAAVPLPRPASTAGEPGPELREKVALLRELIQLEKELEEITQSPEPPSSRMVIEHIVFRLEEIIERHNAQPINGDRWFDTRRHQAVPAACVPDGTPILETLRPGWVLNNQVLRRARVRVEPN